nr:MAG TPA: hypothetical protein [Caudoviricetes sp.]
MALWIILTLSILFSPFFQLKFIKFIKRILQSLLQFIFWNLPVKLLYAFDFSTMTFYEFKPFIFVGCL